MKPTRLLLVAAAILAPALARAQAPDSLVLTVTPDHADWLYRIGDSARFVISAQRGGRTVPGLRASVQVALERMTPMSRDTIDLSSGPRTVTAALRQPGFLRTTVSATVDGRNYTSMATVGFEPLRITATTTAPADLMAFWQKAIADARKVPLAPMMIFKPEWSTPEVNAYHISFQNQSATSRIYGVLSVPTKPGKYPAILNVPGAGVRPYFPNVNTAKRGVIYLSIGIHGIPVDRDSLLYNELRATALARYYTYGIESRDTYYYKRVYVGVVRAGDFIATLPQFDGTNYAVEGRSQGGGLSLVAGVLDPRVKAIAVTHPAMSDEFGYFAGHAGGWPHLLQDTAGVRALPEKMETIRYYDAVNFARLLKIPSFFTFGFNDNTVPPTSSYATYNTVTAPKQLLLAPETGHFRTPAQTAAIREWVLQQLGVR